MGDSIDPVRAARLVRQHAMTARLLGVDFVPLGRAERCGSAADEPVERRAVEADVRPPTPNPLPASAPVAEVKPTAVSKPAARPAAPTTFGFFGEEPARAGSGEAKLLPKLPREEAARRLEVLRARYEADAPHANFVTDHTHIVFGEGDPSARLMFIGEAPGQEEDRTGRPFVGRAGQLLDKMITAMGIRREDVYIANVLKTRPPNNATPTLEEAALCAPYLFAQIATVRPEAIVALGLPATRCLLNTTDPMNRLRGKWSVYAFPPAAGLPLDEAGAAEETAGFSVPVMPTYHPAFILRSYTPENRQKVWSDLKMVMDRLGLKAKAGQGAGPPGD